MTVPNANSRICKGMCDTLNGLCMGICSTDDNFATQIYAKNRHAFVAVDKLIPFFELRIEESLKLQGGEPKMKANKVA